MNTQTFYRKANVDSTKAKKDLRAKFPKGTLVSFETKAASADEAKAARVDEGDLIYEATVRLAEFPPADDGGEEKKEAPEPKEESEPKDDGGDSESDDGGSDDGPPEFGSEAGGDDGLGEPKKMSPEEETVHLLHQILDVLKGGGGLGPGGPGDLGPDAGLDLPDVGAPPKGGGLPPPGAPPTKAPLPPPVKPKAPMGGPAFSHYNPDVSSFTSIVRTASSMDNKQIIEEAAQVYPTHKVAKIQRSDIVTVADGRKFDCKKNDIAAVTLVRK